MKKLAFICFILVSIHARADLLITQLVEVGGQSQTMTSKIKGDMVRTDIAAQLSSITNTTSGDVIMMMHEQKNFVKITAAQTKELMDKVQAMNPPKGAQPTERPLPVTTGKKEKVNDYDTEVFTAETPTMKFTYWVSKDYPNGAAVQQQMKKLQDSMQSKIGSSINSIPDISKLPGLPLKTEMVTGGNTTTTTLVSVKDAPIDAADFQVPADYKETHIPGINAPAAAAPAAATAP